MSNDKTAFRLNRQTVERMMTDAQMRPETKQSYKGQQIFIADGFSKTPAVHYRKLGIEPGEFPNGVHCTIWFVGVGEEKLDAGAPAFFEPNHNPEWDEDTKKSKRIEKVLENAKNFIDARAKARSGGSLIHA